MTISKKTPLHSRHLQLGARMVDFAGYSMPVQYSGLLEETKATRSAGGLFDVSHMGQFWIRGQKALEQLERLTTNDPARLAVGQAQYSMFCNESGGVIDDVVVYRRDPSNIFICVNASNRLEDLSWLKSNLAGVDVVDESDETGLIAIQGPSAVEVLGTFVNSAILAGLKYYWAAEARFGEVPIYLSRTGYTGEDGFEIYCPGDKTPAIWDALVEKGRSLGVIPCGLGARDTLRTEMGYPLHGHELSPSISPLEAGLGWVVKMTRPFIGKEALETQLKTGPPRTLKGLRIQDRRLARPGYRIYVGDQCIGQVTSGTFSPHLNAPIAIALIDSNFKDAPTLEVQIREDRVLGAVTKTPFISPHTRK